MKISIATYNLLSSHLAQDNYFTHCAKDALKPNLRWTRLWQKLEVEVKRGSIICMQEISQKWGAELHVALCKVGWHFIPTYYGSRISNHMGIGIAFDPAKYELIECSIRTLGETREFPRAATNDDNADASSSGTGHWWSWLASLWSVKRDATSTNVRGAWGDPFERANQRENVIVGVKLRCRASDVTFAVVNYHMPCAFDQPKLMVIHTSLAATFALKFAGHAPLVLAGDWNFKPRDSSYELITTGSLAKDHVDYPQSTDKWTPDIAASFRSAYREFNGVEPKWTNFAQIRDEPIFIDTLDYVFLSSHWTVCAALKLRESQDDGPQPTIAEPSDHLLLQCELEHTPKPKATKPSKKVANNNSSNSSSSSSSSSSDNNNVNVKDDADDVDADADADDKK